MKKRASVYFALALIGATACSERTHGRESVSGTSRLWIGSSWDTTWIHGGAADSLLLMPLKVTAGSHYIYVLDRGGRRVLSFKAEDGSLAWIAGREGSGPAEFHSPTALALTSSGELLVADAGNSRVSVVDSTGQIIDQIRFPGVSYVQDICALANGDIVMTTLETDLPIVHMSASGEVQRRIDLPWPELRDVTPMARQAFMASTEDFSSCVLALAFGRGFAVYDNREFSLVSDYVEPIAPPEVNVVARETPRRRTTSSRMGRRQIAATNVSVSDGTLAVSFVGKSAHAGKIIDHYDLTTGIYKGSYRFTDPLVALARSETHYFFLHYHAGYPTLVAVRPAQAESSHE